MGRAEFKINLKALGNLEKRFRDPGLLTQLQNVPRQIEIAALVAQAIADNFAQETGKKGKWEPLKGETLRRSIKGGLLKHAQRIAAYKMGALKTSKTTGRSSVNRRRLRGSMAEFHKKTGQVLVDLEKSARTNGAVPGRQILRKTGLLYKTVTTPGYSGSSTAGAKAQRNKIGSKKTNKTVSGSNIYRVEGSNLIWGTNLIYAATHEYGRDPIPQREFLELRPEWEARLTRYVFTLMTKIVKNYVEGRQ